MMNLSRPTKPLPGHRLRLAATAALATLALVGLPACAPVDGGEAERAADGAPAHDHAGSGHVRGGHTGSDHAGLAYVGNGRASHDHGGHGAHAAHGELDGLPADEPADFSIYHAGSVWTDQLGQPRPLDALAGRVQVVGMVYTSCAYACPRMMLDMKRIEGELAPEDRDRVGFVLVSIDPERDTPERLGEYAEGARLDPDRWTLLHGDPGDILEFAALLGVQYRRMSDGEFVHSNLLTVLDPAGRVVHRQLGLGADPAGTLEVIRQTRVADAS